MAKSTPCLLEHFNDDMLYVEFAAAVGLCLVKNKVFVCYVVFILYWTFSV